MRGRAQPADDECSPAGDLRRSADRDSPTTDRDAASRASDRTSDRHRRRHGRLRETPRSTTRRLRSRRGRRSGRWRRSDRAGSDAEFAAHDLDRRDRDTRARAAPAGMNRGGGAASGIADEDRHAVGDHHRQREAGLVRHDRIAVRTLQRARLRALPRASGFERRCRAPASRASGDRASRRPTPAPRATPLSSGNASCLDVNRCCATASSGAAAQRVAPSLAGPMKCGVRPRQRHRRTPARRQPRLSRRRSSRAQIAGFRQDSRWHRP